MKGFELGLKPDHTFEQFSADPASYFKKLIVATPLSGTSFKS